MEITVFPDELALADALASEIFEGIATRLDNGRGYVLGCPGGRTPTLTLKALVEKLGRAGLDLSRFTLAMMDEYAVADGSSFVLVPGKLHFSVRRYIDEHFMVPLNALLDFSASAPISEEQIWFPDPAMPQDYDARLMDAGGVDLFILASGAGDGHIAFNPPGTPRAQRSTVFTLADTTKVDNLATFPNFGGVDEVPSFGVSVGVATIADVSKRAVMVVTGADKRRALSALVASDAYDPTWPSTIVTECRDAAIYVDDAANNSEESAK